jgi:hypothetical protein
MVAIVNNTTYGSGASTLVYALAKARGALLSKPVLIISTSDAAPYRNMMNIGSDWVSPTLKVVLSKMQTYTDVKTFCYKAESYLYYLNIEGIDIKSVEGRKGLNQLMVDLKDNLGEDGFESVWIDIDNASGGFLEFVDNSDLVIIPVRPNKLRVQETQKRVQNIRNAYVERHGMQMKHPIYYCVQMYANQMPLTEIRKILQTQEKYVYPLGYDVEIAKRFNSGELSFYMSHAIAEPKSTEQKVVYNHLRMFLKNLKKQR